ncbi:MAG TPA: hypothetical protein VGS21_07215 [Acidimicrobiales bacterium]|nr:hypothetical protein [Acidimicrobiales bacterium]
MKTKPDTVVTIPKGAHEWVSFPDPDEDRTWVFDVTFLESSWTCIWGRGCQGVLTGPAPELEEGCCSYGAHFTGKADSKRVLRAAERLTDAQWQHLATARKRGGPFKEKDGVTVTRLVDGACIFLNRPGFAGGAGCALHRAAVESGERPLDWKPDVCWQLPLRRVDTTDDHGHVTSTVRQWERSDWGAGGEEFHWWCTESADAFVGRFPVFEALRDELDALVGQKAADLVCGYIEGRSSRPQRVPHPSVRTAQSRSGTRGGKVSGQEP